MSTSDLLLEAPVDTTSGMARRGEASKHSRLPRLPRGPRRRAMPEERELSRMRMPSGLLRVLPGLLACLSACAGDSGSASRRDEAVLVSAASSLTDAFVAVEAAFEAAHPGVDVELNLASSAVLRGADPRGRTGRRFRLGRRGEHGAARRGGRGPRDAACRPQPSPDRRPGRQPGGRRAAWGTSPASGC